MTRKSDYQHHVHTVSLSDQGIRLDLFLTRQHPEFTRSFLKKLIDNRQVLVDGKPVKAGAKLRASGRVDLTVPPPEPLAAEPEAIPLDIVHEDEAILVVNKPPGMVVHPAAGNYQGTLVSAVLHHCGLFLGEGDSLRPGVVHRLDKNTSGVMVVAKNESALRSLAEQFKGHRITRKYLAIVIGALKEPQGTVTSLIGRHATDRKRMSARPRKGKAAVTHWTVLRWYNHYSLVEATLETGRTHQIRVHFSSIHHPVLGDPDYGGRKSAGAAPPSHFRRLLSCIDRQALHARTLGFIHPVRGEYVEFTVPPPEDFQSVLRVLEENG